MRSKIDISELIEQYLNGALTDEETRLLEQKIQSEPDFKKMFEEQQQLHHIIEEASFLDLKDTLLDIHQKSSTIQKRTNRGRYFLGGAILMILTGLIVIWQVYDNKSESLPVQVKAESFITIDTTSNTTGSKTIEHDEGPKNEKINQEKPASQITVANNSATAVSPSFSQTEDKPKIEHTLPPVIPASKENQSETFTTINDDKPEKEKSNPVVPDNVSMEADCDKVKIESEVTVTESCDSKPTGSIRLSTEYMSGGQPPYQISINDGRNFSGQYTFTDLYSGMYSIWVKDKNDCKSKLGNFRIASIDCSYEYVFAPLKDELWEIPSNQSQGKIYIFNQAGKIVWQQILEEGMEYSWDGQSSFGDALPMGIYPFVLELQNKENKVGSVTIVR